MVKDDSDTKKPFGHSNLQPPSLDLWTVYIRHLKREFREIRMAFHRFNTNIWDSSLVMFVRNSFNQFRNLPYSGWFLLCGGTIVTSLLIRLVEYFTGPILNTAILYLPLVAMLSYHWNWRFGIAGAALQFLSNRFLLPYPTYLGHTIIAHLTQDAADLFVTIFILLLVELARSRRTIAEREAIRLTALNEIGNTLAQELDEEHLLHMIAQIALQLTGASFAAFTLRPIDAQGVYLVPSEGNLFRLASVVGVSREEEEILRHISLGGHGALEPIFRQGKSVIIKDMFALEPEVYHSPHGDMPHIHPSMNFEVPHVQGKRESVYSTGLPKGHPIIRSFLGVPLIDRRKEVRGGLLLGHSDPEKFSQDDELIIRGLATQAVIALENARLFRAAQSQAKELDTVFENISDAIILVDEKGSVIRENAAARTLVSLIESTHQDHSRELLREPAISALNGEIPLGATTMLENEFGETREYIIHATRINEIDDISAHIQPAHMLNGAHALTPGAVAVWHDVTDIRRLIDEQKARAESDARRELLQMIIDELPSGIFLVQGIDAKLILTNRAAIEVWGINWPSGMPMQTFLEHNAISITRMDNTPLSGDEFATIRTLATREPIRHFQEIIRRSDGSEIPVLINSAIIDSYILHWSLSNTHGGKSDPDQDVTALMVMQDVSAMKDAERVKDEFIAVAAHELKTPMAAIKGYADMLKIHAADDPAVVISPWQIESLEMIDLATTRLLELTEDLLDVTRMQAGRLDLQPEPHDIVALARRVMKRFQVTSTLHHLTIECTEEYVVVNIDVRRIEQVFSNLIGNAMKYSPDGGNITIQIKSIHLKQVAEVHIQDHGIGIPVMQQSRIFGRFERAENARRFGITGTGLGLYICRELIERHQGHIWFESYENAGTTFFLTLPLVEDEDVGE